MREGWRYEDAGPFWKIVNDVSYAKWVVGEQTQTTMHGKIGWRKTMKNIEDNLKGAFRHAEAELKKWLKGK
jgi:hypothetical protein